MTRVCTICTHDEREGINAALVQGTSYRTIAHQYDVSRYALMRHARDHLPGKMLREAKVRAAPHASAHEGGLIGEDRVAAAPHAPARETHHPVAQAHQGKMPTLANIPAAPHAWAREAHQGKMLTDVNLQAAPRVRVRAATGRATRLCIREHLQAEYGPQLAALGRELDALQGEIEAFKRELQAELQAERKRRAEGSGTLPAAPVPEPASEPEHNEARGVGVQPAGVDPTPEQRRMWGI